MRDGQIAKSTCRRSRAMASKLTLRLSLSRGFQTISHGGFRTLSAVMLTSCNMRTGEVASQTLGDYLHDPTSSGVPLRTIHAVAGAHERMRAAGDICSPAVFDTFGWGFLRASSEPVLLWVFRVSSSTS